MNNHLSDDESSTDNDLVDAVGGEGEFVVVAKSGLPAVTPDELSESSEGYENAGYDGDISSISRRMSSGPAVLMSVDQQRRQSAVSQRSRRARGLSQQKKHVLGLILIMTHCLLISAASQIAKTTYTEDFSAPFFMVYFTALWRIFLFPLYMVVKYFQRLRRQKAEDTVSFMKTYTSCVCVLGPGGLTWRNFLYPCGLLSLLWIVCQFTNVFASKFLNISIVQALFCSETAICYVLSAIFLKTPVYIIKVGAVVLALCGTGLISYSQAGDDLRWEGIAISLTGALLGSGYMVAVKKTIGRSDDIGQVLLLTSAMSVFVILTCWPIVLALYYSGFEYWDFATIPWGAICGTSALMLVCIALFNISLTLTNPMLLTLSKLMSIPVSYGIDAVFWNHQFDVYQIIGVLLIGVGFVFIALPERWLAIEHLKRKILRRKTATPPIPTISITSVGARGSVYK